MRIHFFTAPLFFVPFHPWQQKTKGSFSHTPLFQCPDDAGSLAQSQHQQQQEGVGRAQAGAGRQVTSGLLPGGHQRRRHSRTHGTGQLLHCIAHCIAIRLDGFRQLPHGVGQDVSRGKALPHSEDHIHQGQAQDPGRPQYQVVPPPGSEGCTDCPQEGASPPPAGHRVGRSPEPGPLPPDIRATGCSRRKRDPSEAPAAHNWAAESRCQGTGTAPKPEPAPPRQRTPNGTRPDSAEVPFPVAAGRFPAAGRSPPPTVPRLPAPGRAEAAGWRHNCTTAAGRRKPPPGSPDQKNRRPGARKATTVGSHRYRLPGKTAIRAPEPRRSCASRTGPQ